MPIVAVRVPLLALVAVAFGCASTRDPRDAPGRVSPAGVPSQRAHLQVELAFSVEVPPGAKRLQAWIPLPPDEPGQAVVVRDLKTDPARRHRVTRDSAGNPWAVVEVDAPVAQRVVLVLDVTRSAQTSGVSPGQTRPITPDDRRDHGAWLGGATGIPLTDATRDLATSIVALETNPLVQARRLVDWIRRNIGVREGSGVGDATRALELQAGTSGDLVCVFVALARASGLPARPCHGLVWDAGPPAGKTPIAAREEWWAEVFVPNMGWVSVDPAAAVRAGAPKEGQSGSTGVGGTDERRMLWTRGTDLRLAPPPAAFVPAEVGGPHVEIDGRYPGSVPIQLVVRERAEPALAPPRLPGKEAPRLPGQASPKEPVQPKPSAGGAARR